MGTIGAAGIGLQALPGGMDEQVHVLHRHRAQQHGVTEHQGPYETRSALIGHPHRPHVGHLHHPAIGHGDLPQRFLLQLQQHHHMYRNLAIDLVSKPLSWSVAMGTSAALVRPGSPRSGTPIPRRSPRPDLAKQGFRAGGDGVSVWRALWYWPCGKVSRQRWKPVIWLGTIASSIQTGRIFCRWSQTEPC